jgi:hypothetical protein
MAYSETTYRAAIKTALEGVSNIGQVHDYERWMDDWANLLTLFKATISGVDQLRAWTISLYQAQQEVITFQGGGFDETILVRYTYRVRGYLALDDSAATEKTFTALVLAVMTALEASTTLQGAVLEREGPVVSLATIEHRMFAGVLCHYAELLVHPQEVI